MSDSRSRWPRATEEKNEILLSALKKAWECGYRKGCDLPGMSEDELSSFLRGNDWWSYDSQEEKSSKLKKTSSGKKLKKITPKKPQLSNDLASAAFDPKCCRARFWNQKDKGDVPVDSAGHGMQCWRSADEDFEGYCEKCFNLKTEPEMRTSTTHWFGDFDKPLTESPGEKKDGSPLHDWPAMRKLKASKEKEEKEEKKEKKE